MPELRERALSRILDGAVDTGIVTLDAQGRVASWNASAVRALALEGVGGDIRFGAGEGFPLPTQSEMDADAKRAPRPGVGRTGPAVMLPAWPYRLQDHEIVA